MHPPLAPTKRSLFKLALCAIAAVVLLGLVPASAGAAVPALERFPTYHPQTRCNPKPKPGTVMLARHLMRRYKGSGSLGISRSCRSGGVSEHKEGRAFDWALDAGSRRDRHHARHFLHRLRKPDRLGRRGALARRMGVMYAIWNDHIYSATYHYKKRRYLNAGCRTIRRCPVSLRHRNHMHISLTRAAAHKQTSWYTKHRAGPSKHKVKPKKRHHRKAKSDKPRRHHKVRDRADKRRPHKARHHRHARHHKARPHKARHHKHARHHKKVRRHKARHHEKARQHKKARPHRSKTRHHKNARHHKKARRHSHARHHKARPHKARHHKHARHHKKVRNHRRHRR
jgi:hypothetical protein